MRAPSMGALAHLMVQFMAIHATIFVPLVRQCRARLEMRRQSNGGSARLQANKLSSSSGEHRQTKPPEGIRKLLALERFARLYSGFFMLNSAFYLARSLISRLLSLDLFKPYQLLDCFIVGRIITIGRLNKTGSLAIALFQALFLFYRFHLTFLAPIRFRFDAFEFLLYDYDEVLANEIDQPRDADDQIKPEVVGSSAARPGSSERRWSHRASYRGMQQVESDEAVAQFRKRLGTYPNPRSNLRYGSQARAYDTHEDFQTSERGHNQGATLAANCGRRRNSLFSLRNSACDSDENDDDDDDNSDAEEFANFGLHDTILRPNRTSASWLLMTQLSGFNLLLTFTTILYAIAVVLIFSSAPLVTPMGFEIYYPTCSRHLQHVQQAEFFSHWARNRTNARLEGDKIILVHENSSLPISYSSIHLALNRSLACDAAINESPIVLTFANDSQLLPWTWYTIVRLLFDTLQTYLFYADFAFCFATQSFALCLLSLDVVLNARAIKERLLKLIDEMLELSHHDHAKRIESKQVLHWHTVAATTPYDSHYEPPSYDTTVGEISSWSSPSSRNSSEINLIQLNQRQSPWQAHARRQHDQLTESIDRLQSILIDHFALVRGYNHYVSHYLFLLLLTLFALSGCFTMLIFTLRNNAIELEFYFCEFFSIVCVIYIFIGPCVTHIYNSQLNPLISSAMALDSCESLSKFRWMVMMKYYQPMPLHCFTLFQQTPVSWLFCLKLLSWFFSAIFVLTNFLHMYR